MCEILNCTILLQNNYVTIGTGDDHYPNVYMSLSDDWTTNQVSQLLQKLRTDLHLSFHSFLKEFVAQPNDGVGLIFVTHLISYGFTWKRMIKETLETLIQVTLLLDLLKLIQLSQTNSNNNKQTTEDPSNKQQVWEKQANQQIFVLLIKKLI